MNRKQKKLLVKVMVMLCLALFPLMLFAQSSPPDSSGQQKLGVALLIGSADYQNRGRS